MYSVNLLKFFQDKIFKEQLGTTFWQKKRHKMVSLWFLWIHFANPSSVLVSEAATGKYSVKKSLLFSWSPYSWHWLIYIGRKNVSHRRLLFSHFILPETRMGSFSRKCTSKKIPACQFVKDKKEASYFHKGTTRYPKKIALILSSLLNQEHLNILDKETFFVTECLILPVFLHFQQNSSFSQLR